MLKGNVRFLRLRKKFANSAKCQIVTNKMKNPGIAMDKRAHIRMQAKFEHFEAASSTILDVIIIFYTNKWLHVGEKCKIKP